MSSRAVRKALKRLEAQKELEKKSGKDSTAEDEDNGDEEDITMTPSNPFAMVIFRGILAITVVKRR